LILLRSNIEADFGIAHLMCIASLAEDNETGKAVVRRAPGGMRGAQLGHNILWRLLWNSNPIEDSVLYVLRSAS
jgi:hypothetical protein